MTALDTPDLEQDPEDSQDPQGKPQMAAGGTLMMDQGPPPVLPPPQDEHDLEVSLNLIKQSLQARSQQLNLQHLQQMAAAGQMQAYDSAMMQQATGGQLEEEMALMSFGMPQTNVRIPENRKAYEDWFGDMERRATTAGIGPERMAGVKKRYSDFHGLAQSFDQDKSAIATRISSLRNYYEGGSRGALELIGSAGKGLTGGHAGLGTRQEDMLEDVKEHIESLVTQRFPRGESSPSTTTGWEKPKGQKGSDEEMQSYRKLLVDESWDQLRKTFDRPGMAPGTGQKLATDALHVFGEVLGFGKATKIMTAGAAKVGLGKAAPHIGSALGFGAFMGLSDLNPEQKHRISKLPEGDRFAAQVAGHLENAGKGVIFAPLYGGFGKLGEGVGKKLAQTFGKSGEGLVSGVLKGAASGLALPLAPEIENQLLALGTEHIPALRDLVDRKLVSKPELQTPLVGMANSARAGDGQSFIANLERYVKEALPGMIAFGTFHGIAGMRTAFKADALDVAAGKMRELRARADKEAEKAAGDPKVAEQLKQGLDEAQEKVEEAAAQAARGPGEREKELGGQVGTEEAKRAGDEAEVIESAGLSVPPPRRGPVSESSRRLKGEPDDKGEKEPAEEAGEQGIARPEGEVGQDVGGVVHSEKLDTKDLRRQEKLLTRRIERTEDPVLKAELAAARAELRTKRREADKKTLGFKEEKPKTVEEVKAEVVREAAEAGDTESRQVARGKAMALRYEEAARSPSLSPKERVAAANKATEWTGYHKEAAAWAAAGAHGEPPIPPSRGSDRVRRETEQGERASRRLTEPMPVREQAAAQSMAYREGEQRVVDEASASGKPVVGLEVEDIGGHKAVVEAVTKDEVHLRNAEGELEIVPLEKGALPEELALVGKARKPQRRKEDEQPEGHERAEEEHKEIVDRPRTESTSALEHDTEHKAQLDTMHAEVESLGTPEASGILREISNLKVKAGAKTTDMVRGYAEIAAGKMAPGPAREFAEFVAKHADLAANRHGERFTAEMVYQWQAKKLGWPADPRGETMGELTRWLQDELSQVIKEVRLTGDMDTFKGWAAHQSMLLTGPWAAAARVHPDGKLILKRVAEMESGEPPSRDAGFLRVPNPIKVWDRIRHFRSDFFTTLLDQAHANPLAHPKLIHKLTASFFAMPIGEFGYVGQEKIASEVESRAALDQLYSDFFDVQTGILRHAKADREVDKMLHKLLDEPRSPDSHAIYARRHTDPKAKQALQAAVDMRRWNKKALEALIEVHPTANALRNAIRTTKRDVRNLTDAWAGAGNPKVRKAIKYQLDQATSYATRLEQSLERFKDSYGIKDYMRHIPRYEIVGGALPGMRKSTPSGVSAIEAKRQVYSDITIERKGGLKKKGLLGDSAWQAVNHYMHSIVPLTFKSRFINRIEERLYGSLDRLDSKELMGGRDGVIFGELKEANNLGFYDEVKVPYTTKKGTAMNITTFAKGKRGQPAAEGKVLLWVGKGKAPTAKQLADVKWVTQHMQTAKNPERGLIAVDKSVASRTFRAMKGGLWEHIGKYQQGRLIEYINDGQGMREQMTGALGEEYQRMSHIGQRVARWTASWMSAIAMGGNIHNAANNIMGATALNALAGVNAKDASITTQFLKRHVGNISRRAAGRVIGQPEGARPKPSKEFDPESYALSDTWDALYRTPKEILDKMAPEARKAQELADDTMVGLMQSGVLGQNHANRSLGVSASDKRWGEPEQPGKILRKWQPMRRRLLEEKTASGTSYTLMEPGETVRKGKSGQLERVKPDFLDKAAHIAGNIGEVIRPITDPIGKAWWSAFGASETAIRAPIFVHGYRTARELGRTHSESIAEGIMAVHLTQMVYVHSAKSAFFNSPVGTLLGNLSGWTASVGGRMLALPIEQLAVLAGFNVACMSLVANTMGIHGFNLFGSTLRDLPMGAQLEDLAFQLGVKTKQDPQGLTHKGMVYNAASKAFDMHALPLPTPIPVRFGPIVPLMESLVKAGKEAARGNGEQAAKALWQATGSIDPLRSNAMRQIYKAFGVPSMLPEAYQSENRTEAGGSAVYQPPGSRRGSTLVESQGWKQFGLEMLPGAPIREAYQWQENQLARARNELLTSRHKEMNEQGRQLMHHLGGKKLQDLPREDQEVFKGMRADLEKTGKELGRPIKRSDLEEWQKTAEFESKTDARLRAALSSPSKVGKVREITKLLEDPGYNLSLERWKLLTEHVKGAKATMTEWLEDKAAPVPKADRDRLGKAYALRKRAWGQ